MAEEGIDQRDLSQFLDVSNAQVIKNYLINASGQLVKIKGYTELFDA